MPANKIDVNTKPNHGKQASLYFILLMNCYRVLMGDGSRWWNLYGICFI